MTKPWSSLYVTDVNHWAGYPKKGDLASYLAMEGGGKHPNDFGSESQGSVEEGVLLARVHVPELNVSKCLQFPKDQLVWDVKQQCLASLPKVCTLIDQPYTRLIIIDQVSSLASTRLARLAGAKDNINNNFHHRGQTVQRKTLLALIIDMTPPLRCI